jgi:hypothetical protein
LAHRERHAPAAVADRDAGPSRGGVQELIDWARTERAHLSLLSFDRAYYLGIEVAAEQVLHPDVEAIRSVGWLDRCNPAFASGYMETVARLTPFWSWSSVRRSAGAGTSNSSCM